MVDVYSIAFKADTRQVKKADADLGNLGKQTTATGKSVQKFGSQVDKATAQTIAMQRASSLARKAVASLGAALSIRAIQQFSAQALQSSLNIERQAASLAMTAEEFQRMSFAFGQFGSDSADISDALNTLSDRAEDAKDGMQSFVDDFALLGIEVDDLQGRDPQGLFRLLAERVSQIEDPTRRAAGVVRILGDDLGRRLLPLLMGGTEEFDRLAASATVASDEVVNSSADIQRNIQQTTATIRQELSISVMELATVVEDNLSAVRAFGEVVAVLVAYKLGAWAITAAAGVKTLAGAFALLSGPGAPLLALSGILFAVRMEMLETKREANELAAAFNEMSEAQLVSELERALAEQRELVANYDQTNPFAGPRPQDVDRQRELATRIEEIRFALQRLRQESETGVQITITDGQEEPEIPEQDPFANIRDMQFVNALDDGFKGVGMRIEDMTGFTNGFHEAMKSVGDSLNEVSGTIETSIGNALEDMIVRGESARDVFQALARDIAAAVLRQSVINPAASVITGAITGMFPTSAPASGASAGQMQNMSFLPGGAAANGGNAFRDRAMLVGERGPEVFVPGQDGRIVPNHQIGGSPNVTVNVINEGGQPLQAGQQQTRRGSNGETTIDVMVKSSMERLDSQGQLDGIFRRHGAARQGQF